MDLVIYTDASDLFSAAVTSTTDLTPVEDFAALVYGDQEPVNIRLTTGTAGGLPSWCGVEGHGLQVAFGYLGTNGSGLMAATAAFTYAAETYLGLLSCASESFAAAVRGGRNERGYGSLQVRHVGPAGEVETLAIIQVPYSGAVPAASGLPSCP